MKQLKLFLALIDGKKRAIGGIFSVFIDLFVILGKLDAGIGNKLKMASAGLFGIGIGHALNKAK